MTEKNEQAQGSELSVRLGAAVHNVAFALTEIANAHNASIAGYPEAARGLLAGPVLRLSKTIKDLESIA